ncbi:hypothetical protein ACFL4T_13785 [candidate division KSB1 bacterium]
MRNTTNYLWFLLCLILFNVQCSEKESFPVLRGDYLGQNPPGTTPELFAPGIVTTRHHEHSAPAFSPDGNEVFWSAFLAPLQSKAPQVILYSKLENGKWTKPEVAPFSGQYPEGGPCFSYDGNKLFYGSRRPADGKGEPKDWDIWFVERLSNGWSEPKNPGAPINSEKSEGQPTITKDGTLYFLSDHKDYQYENCIFRSRFLNGRYEKPEPLSEPINIKGSYSWCPFIAPDESYMLFVSNREGGLGWGDIYVSYRGADDSWTEPKNLGAPICSDDNDRFPKVSPDGKVLFFASKRTSIGAYYTEPQSFNELMAQYANPGNGLTDIYWVSVKIIEELKPDELK